MLIVSFIIFIIGLRIVAGYVHFGGGSTHSWGLYLVEELAPRIKSSAHIVVKATNSLGLMYVSILPTSD